MLRVHLGETAIDKGEQPERLQNNRKAKKFRLTAAGKRRPLSRTENWKRMAEVIAGILRNDA